MTIPLIDLKRGYHLYGRELEEAVLRVMRSGMYLNGPETSALERELADYLGVRYAVGVASGTEALHLILKALELPKNSYVLLPSFTFVATCEVVLRAGLRPYFVDIEPDTGNLSPSALRDSFEILKRQGKLVSAVIAVSIFGIPAELEEISSFCSQNNLILIEDFCQAFGAELAGKKVGSFGFASATSFYPTKNLSAFGDGGMVFTNDETLAKKIRILKEHGQTKSYYYEYHGINGRIDEIQCAILRVKFRYFPQELELRRTIAKKYFEHLAPISEIRLFKPPPHGNPAYSIFSIRVPNRDSLRDFLEKRGISTRIYYPLPLHLQPVYRDLSFSEGDLPQTEALCKEVLSLPFHPYLTEEEQETVIRAIYEFFEG